MGVGFRRLSVGWTMSSVLVRHAGDVTSILFGIFLSVQLVVSEVLDLLAVNCNGTVNNPTVEGLFYRFRK